MTDLTRSMVNHLFERKPQINEVEKCLQEKFSQGDIAKFKALTTWELLGSITCGDAIGFLQCLKYKGPPTLSLNSTRGRVELQH